ncbi:MAG: YihY/virulence factor BrkB family protein [Caulobacteraceae bacterium]
MAARAWRRTQNRHAALYVGGVCFSAMLAIFPALAILVGLYSLMFTPDQAAAQGAAFARLMPPGPQSLFQQEMTRLAHAPIRLVSAQSALALLIAFYASQRGVKALLAGLSLIHDEERPRGFVGFNVLAVLVALAGFALVCLISAAFLAVRVAATTFDVRPVSPNSWIFSEWTWASIGMALGLTLIYRLAMSSRPVIWSASIIGAVVATVLSLLSSWIGAIYVQQVAHFGATYGSVTAVVVFLVWLSWNVNAIFYGGAVATEIEILSGRRVCRELKRLAAPPPQPASRSGS